MWQPFYTPQPIVETVSAGFLEPVRPKPRERPLGLLGTVLGARHNLIANWLCEHYRAHVDTFRIGPRQVVVANTPEAVKHVMATHNAIYERKSPQMRRALEFLLGDGLFISDGETWRRRRPLVADIVHKTRLPRFAPTMEHAAREMARRWETRAPGERFDVLVEMAELTAEIIARTVFGSRLGSNAAGEVIAGFSEYQRRVDSFNLPFFLGVDEGFPVIRTRRLRKAVGRVHAVVDEIVSRHLAGEGDADSMLALLVRRKRTSPELELDVTAIRNEAATIFMAGHETTASVLTWAWYCLSRAPWAEQALHRELDAVLGGRPPALGDLPALPYTRAVIEETLRLYPPVPILPRQAGADDRIGDVAVERAALVLVVPWLLHRAVGLWDEPNRFLPERFLEKRPAPYTYIPFAAGPRICAGLSFGLSEASLCLATLAQRFRVRVEPSLAVEPLCRLTLRPKNGLPVTVERRS
jgi:cytochrome P450